MNRLLVTAHHEAAHAVACQLRGGTVESITLVPGVTTYRLPRERQKLFRNGVQIAQPQPQPVTLDEAFVAYAGPWASVRCRWNLPLDARDEHGNTFDTYMAAILKQQTHDYATYQAVDKPTGIEAQWSADLEESWARIQTVARRMYAAHRQHLLTQRRERLKNKRARTTRTRV